ncbi:predicted protein [Nematostella vectensis]|uniref:G-protein coupled receptors family 1 profile domain-containing protein n=1 Tax=Nematostella vectensis TaxID=45351 RepID=A7RJ24_NEMVE|nr:predicted protein [Nematostella vectensis]|eukprot:XP_001640670.1 predicted protein [Nematostella vectensis]
MDQGLRGDTADLKHIWGPCAEFCERRIKPLISVPIRTKIGGGGGVKINVTNIQFLISSAQTQSGTLEVSIRMTIIVLIFIATGLGNGSILVMIKRFNTLRTTPNILIANLAFIDLMNVVINLPLVAVLVTLQFQRYVKGRFSSAMVASLQSAFVLLNLFDMTLMMIDRYFVIQWGMRYKVWSTVDKALWAVLGTWLLTIIIMIPWFLYLYEVDLGDAPNVIYRMVYYYMIGDYMTIIRTVFTALFAVMALMTWYSIRKQTRINEKKLSLHNHGLHLKEARRRMETHAATTVGLTVGAYVITCIPLIIYGVLSEKASNLFSTNFLRWFGIMSNLFQFISSMCNPFIYMARCKRYNQALKLLLKDPFGTSEPTDKVAVKPTTNRRFNPKSNFLSKRKVPSPGNSRDAAPEQPICRDATTACEPNEISVTTVEIHTFPDSTRKTSLDKGNVHSQVIRDSDEVVLEMQTCGDGDSKAVTSAGSKVDAYRDGDGRVDNQGFNIDDDDDDFLNHSGHVMNFWGYNTHDDNNVDYPVDAMTINDSCIKENLGFTFDSGDNQEFTVGDRDKCGGDDYRDGDDQIFLHGTDPGTSPGSCINKNLGFTFDRGYDYQDFTVGDRKSVYGGHDDDDDDDDVFLHGIEPGTSARSRVNV